MVNKLYDYETTYPQVFNTKITVMSLVDLPHMVTESGKVTERW